MSTVIIDRRKNDRGKSTVNRQRFIERYKHRIQESVDEIIADRSIKDVERGGKVSVPIKDLTEPSFRHGKGGDREYVHPGNKKFNSGDRLPRPSEEDGSGGTGSGEGEDDFVFTLSREEYLNLLFENLGLPHLVRNKLGGIREFKWRRAGYTPSGVPTRLDLLKSVKQACMRRIAARGVHNRRLEQLHLDAALAPEDQYAEVVLGITQEETKIKKIPFLDDIDLRYRHRVKEPQPIAQAVMFCLMDVSASMTEAKKDLAKRFFTLLYLFLTRMYEKVEIVFIRHTDEAKEVGEQEFFYGTQSGGTTVLSALTLMHRIVTARFDLARWNVYGAQASDGDSFGNDPGNSRAFLEEKLLPLVRYFTYAEAADEEDKLTALSAHYNNIKSPRFAMAQMLEREDAYRALRRFFAKEVLGAAA